MGVAYSKSDAHSTDNNNYVTIVSMAVPAGKYQVSGRITESNQTGATIDDVACNAYGNAGGDISIDSGNGANFQSGQASSFPITGVVALAAAGTIRIECISSNPSLHNVGAHVVAVTVADIVNAP